MEGEEGGVAGGGGHSLHARFDGVEWLTNEDGRGAVGGSCEEGYSVGDEGGRHWLRAMEIGR